MKYEELLINIDLNGYENVLPFIGRICLDCKHWFVVCDDGDCHFFDENGIEDDIKKVTTIYEYMIPKNIKKIVIPNSVKNIESYAFENCSRLISVMIPNSVTSIGNHAFFDCRSLASVTIPNSIMSIRGSAFFECCSLKNVIINKPIDQVMSMENYPFGIKDESIIKCI